MYVLYNFIYIYIYSRYIYICSYYIFYIFILYYIFILFIFVDIYFYKLFGYTNIYIHIFDMKYINRAAKNIAYAIPEENAIFVSMGLMWGEGKDQ